MKQLKCLLYNNDCYKAGVKIKPTRIIVHSTGVPNPYISRYVQPHANQSGGMGGYTRDEMMGILGKNKYQNDWNRSGLSVAVHAFIGKLADESIATVQTLPWQTKSWGVGKGTKGSFNGTAIQFEICEDDLTSKTYFKKVYNEAVELCVMLCKKYNIPVENVISHKEAHKLGYGSNHGDIDHWLVKFGYTMKDFRKEVERKLNGSTLPYKVKVNANKLNIRKGPGKKYSIAGQITDKGVYTITEEKDGWGYLLSQAGWIYLKGYTSKYKG